MLRSEQRTTPSLRRDPTHPHLTPTSRASPRDSTDLIPLVVSDLKGVENPRGGDLKETPVARI